MTVTTNLTFNKETANIVCSYTSTSIGNFDGGSQTFNNVTFSDGRTGALTFNS